MSTHVKESLKINSNNNKVITPTDQLKIKLDYINLVGNYSDAKLSMHFFIELGLALDVIIPQAERLQIIVSELTERAQNEYDRIAR